MEYKSRSRFLAAVLAISIVFSAASLALAAPSDVADHWAEAAIERWGQRGVIQGYPDGTFRPDGYITRAEFSALINRTHGYTSVSSVSFVDADNDEWYYNDLEKAKAAGYILGDPGNTVRPDDSITRQEVAVILARLLQLSDSQPSYAFTDAAEFPSWSKSSIMGCANRGLILGYPDNSFGPETNMTRAEVVTVLDRLFAEVYNTSGVFGSTTKTEVDGSVVVLASGVTLQNLTIKGDLLIAQLVGDGDVTLKNVTVEGKTQISGGGEHTVLFQDCTIGTITVDRDGNIRIVAEGSTVVLEVVIGSGIITLVNSATGEAFESIVIPEGISTSTNLELSGSFANVEVNSPIGITIGSDSSVATMTIEAAATIEGAANIGVANLNASGANLDARPQSLNVASGVTGTVGGGTVGTTTPPPSGGGSDDDDDEPSTIAVTGVSLDHSTLTLVEGGETSTLSATVTPSNATNRSVTWSSSDTSVATVAGGVVTPIAEGTATITVTTVSGGKTATCMVTVFKRVARADGDVTQDPGKTGGDGLTYNFDAETSTLTIDADNQVLPYYPAQDDTPPTGAHWVGMEIPVPEDVDTDLVSSTINGVSTTNRQFFEGKHFEYISIEEGDFNESGIATYVWVIHWDSGWGDETITVNLMNVGSRVSRDTNSVTQDPGTTGGSDIHYDFAAADKILTVTGGSVPYVEYDGDGFPPTGGHWVGVAIDAPEGVEFQSTDDIVALTIDGNAYNLPILSAEEKAEGELWYYFKAITEDDTHTLRIVWSDEYLEETITIRTSGLTLDVVRADGDVTQDPGVTGGSELTYTFVAGTSTLTIDAHDGLLPHYPEQGSTPPTGSNWVGLAIPVPEGVDTASVTSTIDGVATVNRQFFEGTHFEYISVEEDDLDENGNATYVWVISWGSGWADETITVNLINVGDLAEADE